MTVALAGRAPATFEIKSATLPLVALLLKSPDLALLAEELKARFGDMPEFFDHDPLVVDLSPLATDAGTPDFPALLHLLRAYRVLPIAVKGGTEAQMQAAQDAGLVVAADVVLARDKVSAPPETSAPAAAPQAAREARVAPPPPASALIIDK
ncbi:MAG: septum site-determining protein MinC, partial [Comamonadaceae bacterium]